VVRLRAPTGDDDVPVLATVAALGWYLASLCGGR
jgi:hypothetical protein